ncbi:hypothetical protein SNK05_007378 [Fusarium graminearum]
MTTTITAVEPKGVQNASNQFICRPAAQQGIKTNLFQKTKTPNSTQCNLHLHLTTTLHTTTSPTPKQSQRQPSTPQSPLSDPQQQPCKQGYATRSVPVRL